jgi:mono/diheme cytochrome c family protein
MKIVSADAGAGGCVRRAEGGSSRGAATAVSRMMRGRMPRRRRSIALSAAALVLALPLAACGEGKITVSSSDQPAHTGAELFQQRCAGCHTLAAAGTHGSAANIRTRERTDGPNFNVRRECVERVLYAIENGGFSGAIMPQNIVVGRQAQDVAAFVAEYAGAKAKGQRPPGTGGSSNGYHCTPVAHAANGG